MKIETRVETLRTVNVEETSGGIWGDRPKCCHGTPDCPGRGEKHWCDTKDAK